jgi:GNAT superfamily N-acetyltransferase
MAARVRAATPADFSRVQALVYTSHARALAATRDVTPRLPLIFPTLSTAELFSAPTSRYWVADTGAEDIEIVGAVSIIMEDNPAVAELNAFYVAEGCQRQGVGARLIGEALSFCRERGVKRVELTSNQGHYDAAIAYYLRLGFKQEKPAYEVAPGIVLVDLALELS